MVFTGNISWSRAWVKAFAGPAHSLSDQRAQLMTNTAPECVEYEGWNLPLFLWHFLLPLGLVLEGRDDLQGQQSDYLF